MKHLHKTGRQLLLIAIAALGFANASAQALQQVQRSFDQYQENVLQEKIYVHTDRTTYMAGDIIWFKVYCLDAASHKPLNVSKVAYVEILDNGQVATLQGKISLKNGLGSGSFVLPASFNTGNFKIRAYTNWMKNFGPESFFEQRITIINTLRAPVALKELQPVVDVQFFSEGGNLIGGLPCTVAFKAIDQNGRGVDFRGAILDARNDTVARFQPLQFGMGRFVFTPIAGVNYKAIIKLARGMPLTKSFPLVNSSGYSMELTAQGDIISVKVRGTLNSSLYLFAHAAQLTTVAQSAEMANGAAIFTFNKNKLGSGISHITIFNNARQPVCERLYFKRPVNAISVTANADLPVYTSRKKVNVSVAVKNASGQLTASNLSMAVFKADSLQHMDQDDIVSYLWLSSDLKGNIQSPGYYLKNTSAGADMALDNLMLTQGWRRFKWVDLLQNKADRFKYLPEYNGHLVTAKATDSASKQAAKGVIGYLAVPGKRVQMYAAMSDSAGRMLFNTKDFFGANEVVVQTNTETDTIHKIEILSPFSEQYSSTYYPGIIAPPSAKQSLENAGLAAQIVNIYHANQLKNFYDPGVDSSSFFGTPFRSYKLDDYTRFLSMEEVLKEYIREVAVSRSKGRFHITVHDENANLSGDPLVLLDGVPIFNIDKVLALDPLKIKKLDVVRKRYYYGPSVYEGILSFTTYKGDLAGTEMDPHAIVVDYDGMQLQREFYSPVYDTDQLLNSRLPDFRNLLYWLPNVNTTAAAGKDVSFYTSDQTGKFIGVVQGITANGEAGVQTFTFEVK